MNYSTLKKASLILLLLFSLTTNQFYAQESEPNNTLATSDEVPIGGTITGTLDTAGGTDYFQIISEDDGNLTVSITLDETVNGRVGLFYKSGSFLGESTNGTGVISFTRNCIAEDTLIARVVHSSGAGSYLFSYSTDSPPSFAQDAEPNNNISQINYTIAENETVGGRMGYVGTGISDSQDFYYVLPDDDGNITIDATFDSTMTGRIGFFYKSGSFLGESSTGTGELTFSRFCVAEDTLVARVILQTGCGSYELAFSTDSPPSFVQDQEPNNSISQINYTIAENETVGGRMGYVGTGISDSQDFYYVLPDDDGNITIDATFDSTMTGRIGFFYKSGSFLGESSTGTGELTFSRFCVAEDTLVARVILQTGCGSYELAFSTDSPPSFVQDQEPNNSISQINYTIAENETVGGRMGYVGTGISDSQDFYYILPDDDGTININATFDSTMTGRIGFFYKSGSFLGESSTGTGELTFSRVCVAEDTLVARVILQAGCGSYELTFTGDHPFYDNDEEPNSSFTTASPMLMGEKIEGHIGYSGTGISDPTDYHSFEVVESPFELNAKITTNGTFIGRLGLFSPSGSFIGESTNQSGSFSFTYTINTPGTYALRLITQSGCGSYILGDLCANYPTVEASPPGPVLKCPDEPITLSATEGLSTYAWYNGTDQVGTTQSINAASSGNYTVVGYDVNGCPDTSNVVMISALNCDDGDACTIDSCVDGDCIYLPVDCDDGNACTIDSCDPSSGCVYVDVDCNDGDACTIDTCDSVTGCDNTAINCDDNDACTTDSCMDGNCVNTPIICNDNDASTTDSCDPVLGCVHTPIACDDANVCTIDTSDPVNGCVHTPIDCNDGDACTVDTCDPAIGCVFTDVDCNDNDASTTDSCDPTLGCVNTPIECDDGDACTLDTSNPFDGCINTPIDCDDFNACTLDLCDPNAGCLYTNIDCDDDNACTLDVCDSVLGCVYSDVDCDDGDPCTDDFCDTGSGCANAYSGDNDNDGTCNNLDQCPDDPNKIEPGNCGCGAPEPNESCDDGNPDTIDDTVQADCSCVGESIFDCPDLQANVGDECDDGNDDLFPGTVNDLCECEPGMEEFDCPELHANLGDECDDFDEATTNDMITEECVCMGTILTSVPNDNPIGAIFNTPDRLWGVPGWDSFEVGCATLSLQSCDNSNPTSDSWYKFIAQSENQGILVRPNPSDLNAQNVDLVVQVFDANLDPLTGLTQGTCGVDRSCFNNYGNGEIERAVPTGLIIGELYFYRVYDANGWTDQDCSRMIDTKVKTYANHGVTDGCDQIIDGFNHSWTIESPSNLYNIPPVPVFDVRMTIKDAMGVVVGVSNSQNPNAPGGLTFDLDDFPLLASGDYTVHAQNHVKMMANGCVSAYWSQLGPECALTLSPSESVASPSLESSFNESNVSFTIYPNPNTGDQVSISMLELSNESETKQLCIYDSFGKRIHQESIVFNDRELQKEIYFTQELSSGLYFVQISAGSTSSFAKMIVE